MISREYGGPSKIGGTTKLIISAASAVGMELVFWTEGESLFQPASFVLKASVPVYVGRQRQDSTNAANGINTHSFELDAGVYWRIDVDRPEERAIAFKGITSDGYVKVTRISNNATYGAG